METVQLYAIPRYVYIFGQNNVKSTTVMVLVTFFASQISVFYCVFFHRRKFKFNGNCATLCYTKKGL